VWGQLGGFIARRRLHPPEPDGFIGMVDIHPIEEQRVKIDIRIQRAAKALDQGDRAGVGRLAGPRYLGAHIETRMKAPTAMPSAPE